MAGFEPAASRIRTVRSGQAELHPGDEVVCDWGRWESNPPARNDKRPGSLVGARPPRSLTRPDEGRVRQRESGGLLELARSPPQKVGAASMSNQGLLGDRALFGYFREIIVMASRPFLGRK